MSFQTHTDRRPAAHPNHVLFEGARTARPAPVAASRAVRGELRATLELRYAGRREVCLCYERVGDPSLPWRTWLEH